MKILFIVLLLLLSASLQQDITSNSTSEGNSTSPEAASEASSDAEEASSEGETPDEEDAEEDDEDFAPYMTNDCNACKRAHPEAYFCNYQNIQGYCCPDVDESAEVLPGCNETDTITCAKEFYYTSCINATEDAAAERCGGVMSFHVDSYNEVDLYNMGDPTTACVFEFEYHKGPRYKVWGYQQIQLLFAYALNVDIIIAS